MQRLKPTKASKSGRVFLLVFATFWTGFSIIWTLLAWGGGGGMMALFGLPFIVIGVLLFAGALWRTIAGVRIAPPVVSVSNPTPSLGESVRVAWELKFRTRLVLQESRLELVFRESASYTQGTDRRTDTDERVEDFIELPVGEMEAGQASKGSADVVIPSSGMHTLIAANNRLEWLIRVRLNAREWPDMLDEFSLEVQPRVGW